MKNYKLTNIIGGWLSFTIALIVYTLTVEPTASFWDCGEFIATAFKLQVGHPPGAPLFMILGRIMSIFATDLSDVAFLINMVSVLASAFTISFLFWSITHIARRVISGANLPTMGQAIAALGSGFVGAMAYTFSDTFWFSAVEGEVYATSSFFTAIVFWAILKWENVANEKHSGKWIILIAYLLGLSIGVHLLNLLAIPAMALVYYFKKYSVNKRGLLMVSGIAIALLASIMYGIIPGIPSVAANFDLFFVNTLGMPFHSGTFVYLSLLIGSISGSIWFTFKKNNAKITAAISTVALSLLGIPFATGNVILAIILIGAIGWLSYYLAQNKRDILNIILTFFAVIFIGYSSFAMIVIRSLADPVIDENNPENVFDLLSYLNREQYGDRPLFKGRYYNAPFESEEQGKAYYRAKDNEYEIYDYKPIYSYNSDFVTVFPRMYSSKDSHVRAYKSWANVKGRPVEIQRNNGENETLMCPTFGENLRFFFNYQLGYMYFRYFMWNFAGRQNDIQGHGSLDRGNWISGIKPLDDARLGPQELLPLDKKNNKARNAYYFLPLILGLIGMFYLAKNHKNYFWVVLMFFFFTGLAIVLYLNQTPIQPRERDYAYAGSFYAFTIFIGLGVAGIYRGLRKAKLTPVIAASLATVISIMGVPALMATENWDDHDRSGRYTVVDYAANYLNSCENSGLLFTYGDNDTFPLWYAQDVEAIRTDVRVVNLSLLGTDWYIDQMRRQAYDSEPVKMSVDREKYIAGTRDYLYIIEQENLFFNEKYEANKGKLESSYKAIFERFMTAVENSKLPELLPKDYETLQKGHKVIAPMQFVGLVIELNEAKSRTKFQLADTTMNLLKKESDTFFKQVSSSHLPIDIALDFVFNDSQEAKLELQRGTYYNFFPTRNLKLPVDKKKVIEAGIVPKELESQIVDYIDFTIPGRAVSKSDLFILEILRTNDWNRPIYFASSAGGENFMGLSDYFQYEGLAHRLIPIRTVNPTGEVGRINSKILYKNIMEKFKWGRMEQPDVYIDEQNRRVVSIMDLRNMFARLAITLLDEGDKEKALQVTDKCFELMPNSKFPFNYFVLSLVEIYYQAGETEKAIKYTKQYADITEGEFLYELASNANAAQLDYRTLLSVQELVRLADLNKQPEMTKEFVERFVPLFAQLKLIRDFLALESGQAQNAWYQKISSLQRQTIAVYMQLIEHLAPEKQ